MPASDGLNDLLAGFFGARRQGKTTQVKKFLAAIKAPRLIIFDPMDEYGDLAERVSSLAELNARIRAGGRRFALRYCPPIRTDADMKALPARFDGFCSIALDVGDLLVTVDELHLVTRPSWAPPAWRRCLTLGGHSGLRIIAVSHRPAQVDKVFFSLANLISTCRLNEHEDVTTLANIVGAPRAEVAALRPYQFISRDMVSGYVTRGETGVDSPLWRAPRARTPAPLGRAQGAPPAGIAAPGDGRSPPGKNIQPGARRRSRP